MLANRKLCKKGSNGRPRGNIVSINRTSQPMMKHLLTSFKMLLLTATLLFAGGYAKAQSVNLAASPDPEICLGDAVDLIVTVTGIPGGGSVQSVEFDVDNNGSVEGNVTNGTAGVYTFTYTYGTAGNYTIKANVKFTGGTPADKAVTLNVVVYSLPVADFTMVSGNVQCFRGNSMVFSNQAVPGNAPSNAIDSIIVNWGDGAKEVLNQPPVGFQFSHSYLLSNRFDFTYTVYDAKGCRAEKRLLASAPNGIYIKENISPSFDIFGKRGCFGSPYAFKNTSDFTKVPFSILQSFTWDFGDGTVQTYSKPWNLPNDELLYNDITHTYNLPGQFYPALIITDTTGCTDSIRYTPGGNANLPENIFYTFDQVTTKSTVSLELKDSACWGNWNASDICFKQSPIPLVKLNTHDILWNFGDPNSMQKNLDSSSFWVCHDFTDIGKYQVILTIFANQKAPCRKEDTIEVEVLGPKARIVKPSPPPPSIIAPGQQYQCQGNGNVFLFVDFVNNSQYYKSEHVYMRWDFGDDYAPRCTSFTIPLPGFPPPGGWQTADDQFNNSAHYFIMNGNTYPGKMNCKWSYDTLPRHTYPDWSKIYRWHLNGHDFMPWDPGRYTRDSSLANNSTFFVKAEDTLYWNKPVFLNPTNGLWSLTQGTYVDPITGISQPWPRIDTMEAKDGPNDLELYEPIQITSGVPDPFMYAGGSAAYNPAYIIQAGRVDPKVNPTLNGHSVWDPIPQSGADPMSFYQYVFRREKERCISVTLDLQDSLNNESGKPVILNDGSRLDMYDCAHQDQITLALARPDARGMAAGGRQCPGSAANGDNGVLFSFSGQGGTFQQGPGVSPNCGTTFVLFNHDSLADRRDGTPCDLDAFVGWSGGITPGGLSRPVFTNIRDWTNPMRFWQDAKGTSMWYHYGPNSPNSPAGPPPPPADPEGFVTIGLIVGAGCDPSDPSCTIPACVSDTIWYHNFLFIKELDARFFLAPAYDFVNPATNNICMLRCKTDPILFIYNDSIQDSVRYSAIDWGDNWTTVDSFWYSGDNRTDGYYQQGIRRERFDVYTDPNTGVQTVGSNIPFPNGNIGTRVHYDTVDNYTFRLFSSVNPSHPSNPNGDLEFQGYMGANNDSLRFRKCFTDIIYIRKEDTIAQLYLIKPIDTAMMFLPVSHQYTESSWEAGGKKPNIYPQPVFHLMRNVKGCLQTENSPTLIVRGVIDTLSILSQKPDGSFANDTIFCMDEPVYFIDSVRYWRQDCRPSDPDQDPNYNPETGIPYLTPFDAMHFDTIDYWRRESGNINDQRPDGSYIEKLFWDFGDGETAEGARPVHKYKTSGLFLVRLISRDKLGCTDTTWGRVYVSKPVSKPTVANYIVPCNTDASFIDSSFIDFNGSAKIDSISSLRWIFGDNRLDTNKVYSVLKNPTWPYRSNGKFKAKLMVTTDQGCRDTGYVEVYVRGPRPFLQVLSDVTGCAPFKVKVVNLADFYGGLDPTDKPTKNTLIEWGDANGTQTLNVDPLDTVEFTYPDSGTFFIFSRSDDNNPQSTAGCAPVVFPDTADGFNAPIVVTVRSPYRADLTSNKQKVCVGQEFTLTNGSDTASYTQFRFDAIDSTGLIVKSVSKTNQPSDISFPYSLDSTGKYKIVLAPTAYAPNIPQCPAYDTVDIEVVTPKADFTIDSTDIPEFKFNNTSVNASTYSWLVYSDSITGEFVSGFPKAGTQADPDLLYNFANDTGYYKVCLVAFTADPPQPECPDTICQTVSNLFTTKLNIPNVFSPNGDGKNDVFDIEIMGELKYELVIYNRWGTKVFETTDAKKDWNGKNMNDGSDCAEGTYFFIFNYELRGKEAKSVNGTITLLRN